MYFCVNEFEAGINDSIFSGNEQRKVIVGEVWSFAPSQCSPLVTEDSKNLR